MLDLEQVDLRFVWAGLYCICLYMIFRRLQKGSMFEPAIVLISSYLFFLGIGGLFYDQIKDRPIDLYASNLIGVGLIFLLGGLLAVQMCPIYKIINLGSAKFKAYSRIDKKRAIFFQLCGVVCFLFTGLLFFKHGGAPIFADSVNEAKLQFVSGQGHLNVFFTGLGIFSLAFLYHSVSAKAKNKVIISHFIATTVFILLILTAWRTRAFSFLIQYFFLYFFLKKTNISPVRFLILFLMFFFSVNFIGGYRRGLDGDLIGVLASEMGITLTARVVAFELICRNYGEMLFLGGSSYLQGFSMFLPGGYGDRLNVLLKEELFSNSAAMSEDAGITPSILGEAYLNFGVAGIVGQMFIVGALSGLFYQLAISRPTFFRVALYSILVFRIAAAVSSGVGTMIPPFILQMAWVFLISLTMSNSKSLAQQ